MSPRYSAASPIRPAPAEPQPDPARVAANVWRRVERSHTRAREVGGTLYTQVEVCGGAGFEGIIPAYRRVCTPATVDWIFLVAKMLHETENLASWWAAKPRRNPAGIFVTGATRVTTPPAKEGDIWQERKRDAAGHVVLWARGGEWDNWISSPGFPWRPNSVEAHVWRVAGYVLERFSPTQEAAYVRACGGRPLPWFTRGSAGNWRQMGRAHNWRGLLGAGWADPGKDYGERIALIANEITQGAF